MFFFSPLFWEMIQFDEHIFQMGWFNHQLDHKVSGEIRTSLPCVLEKSSTFKMCCLNARYPPEV